MLFANSFLAGLIIAIAGIGYLNVGGVMGAVLFAWGLITIVHMRLKLYTGMAGFYNTIEEFNQLWLILAANLIGCIVGAMMFAHADAIGLAAAAILNNRLALGSIPSFFMAMGCGMIMSIAVKYARQGQYLPLLFGIPMFILCGFPHCIADFFYICVADAAILTGTLGEVIWLWAGSVSGNFIGCNLPRIFGIE